MAGALPLAVLCWMTFNTVAGPASFKMTIEHFWPKGTTFNPYQFFKKFVIEDLRSLPDWRTIGSTVSISKPCRETLWPITRARSSEADSSVSRVNEVVDLGVLDEFESDVFGISRSKGRVTLTSVGHR